LSQSSRHECAYPDDRNAIIDCINLPEDHEAVGEVLAPCGDIEAEGHSEGKHPQDQIEVVQADDTGHSCSQTNEAKGITSVVHYHSERRTIMKFSSLLAIDVIQGLVEEEPHSVQPQGPAGRIRPKGTLHDKYDSGDGMDEESDDGQRIGRPCGWSDLEDLFCDGGPEVVVGIGEVASLVFESADGVLSLGAYVSTHKSNIDNCRTAPISVTTIFTLPFATNFPSYRQ
jgi:hypothetical protein